jgi:hypothetical protein
LFKSLSVGEASREATKERAQKNKNQRAAAQGGKTVFDICSERNFNKSTVGWRIH